MTSFFNRHESDPIDKLRETVEAMERCNCMCRDLALKIHASEKPCFIDVGEAFEKAMEREALKPIPIAPLLMDPEVEKRIWMWHVSFLP